MEQLISGVTDSVTDSMTDSVPDSVSDAQHIDMAVSQSNESTGVAPDSIASAHAVSPTGNHLPLDRNRLPNRLANRRRTRRSKKRKWQKRESGESRSERWSQWLECSPHEVRRIHNCVRQHGQPLAPYNTTQFIMNDHCDREINFDEIHGRIQRTHSRSKADHKTDDDFYSSPEDECDYLEQQFHEAYDNIHTERLNSMSKSELVQEYLQLEDRVEDLEKRLKESKDERSDRNRGSNAYELELQSSAHFAVESDLQTNRVNNEAANDCFADNGDLNLRKALIFQEEIKKLLEENKRLRCENERLQRVLNERLKTESNAESTHFQDCYHSHQNSEQQEESESKSESTIQSNSSSNM